MKRVITFMMALALILSLSVTAFAAGGAGVGSITINNAVNDVNYKLYKIFDATYKADPNPDNDGDGTKDIVAYTLKTSSPIYTYMFNGRTVTDGKIVGDYFTYEVATNVVTLNSGVDNSNVIAYVTDVVRDIYDTDTASDPNDGCFVANKKAANEQVKFDNLDYGYYLIDTEKAGDTTEDKTKIAVTITTNTPSITVNEKNDIPGNLEKTTDDTSVSVGDIIDWEVSFTATNYDGGKKVLKYTITDTLSSDWAEYKFDDDDHPFSVKVGDTTLVKDTDYTLTQTTDENGNPRFVLDIPWMDDGEFLYDPVETVTIKYSATVLDTSTTAGVLKNTAKLEWNYESGGEGGGDEDDEDTDTYNLGFTKVDGADDTKLAGAEFELYQVVAGVEVPVTVNGADGLYIVDPESDSNKVVSNTDGQVVIKGLAAGTYYLRETKAPDGYNKLADPVEMTVGTTKTGAVGGYDVFNDVLTIENNSGVELPSTGGEGTMMMITIGTMVAMAFAVLMITQKKMSIYQD